MGINDFNQKFDSFRLSIPVSALIGVLQMQFADFAGQRIDAVDLRLSTCTSEKFHKNFIQKNKK